jgi:hypothetical protein
VYSWIVLSNTRCFFSNTLELPLDCNTYWEQNHYFCM